jgi:hypothetical protein
MVMAGALALLFAPRPAHADCVGGPHYTLTAYGNLVIACAWGFSGLCTPSTPVLRQDEATGEVVSMAATCDGCIRDECVPPGTYRYGLASPVRCLGEGCALEIPYFGEVTVTAALTSCSRDSSSPTTPTATTVTPPWGTGTNIVASTSCPGGGCATGGCGMAGRDRDGILTIDFLVAAIGLTVVLARRRRASRRT